MSVVAASWLDSPLGRRDPTVKLAVLFLVSIGLLFVLDPVTPAVVFLLGLIGVRVAGRIPPGVLIRAQLPFLGFALGVLTVNAVSRPGAVLAELGPLRITQEGVTVGAALAARTVALGILAVGFVLSTDAVALITSLHRHARLGARPSYALLAGYRLLEQLPREWDTIRQAQAVRAPLRSDGTVRGGPRAWTSAAFTLLVVAIRRGERMARSLESRGLGSGPRTVWRPARIGRADLMCGVTVLAVFGAVIGAAGALGLLRGPGALF